MIERQCTSPQFAANHTFQRSTRLRNNKKMELQEEIRFSIACCHSEDRTASPRPLIVPMPSSNSALRTVCLPTWPTPLPLAVQSLNMGAGDAGVAVVVCPAYCMVGPNMRDHQNPAADGPRNRWDSWMCSPFSLFASAPSSRAQEVSSPSETSLGTHYLAPQARSPGG
jgi:hypothetical protein